MTPSKLQLQRELHDARVHTHRADLSERARARDIARGIGEVGPIEDIEDFPAKDHAGFLAQPRSLDERHVDIALTRPPEHIPSQVAEDRPTAAHGKRPIDQRAIGNEWRGNKDARVEEPVDTAAHTAAPNCILHRLPRRETPCGEVRGRPEERACGTVKNTERESGLERRDSGDCPAFG